MPPKWRCSVHYWMRPPVLEHKIQNEFVFFGWWGDVLENKRFPFSLKCAKLYWFMVLWGFSVNSWCYYQGWLCTLSAPQGSSIPKNVAFWDMRLCTKAALRKQQWVIHRTEPGVRETCQVRSKSPKDGTPPVYFLSGFSRRERPLLH